MDRQPVNSSMMVSIGYDAESGTLEIEYQKGGGFGSTMISQNICGMNFSIANPMESIGMQISKPVFAKRELGSFWAIITAGFF